MILCPQGIPCGHIDAGIRCNLMCSGLKLLYTGFFRFAMKRATFCAYFIQQINKCITIQNIRTVLNF
jgi:hypothetical protein